MKDLDELIYRLKRGITKKSNFIKLIKNPYALVNSLMELNDIIGNDAVKSSIVDQINFLIVSKQKNAHKKNQENVMINTVLCGDPGVGKSLIATKLAKIYQSLGVIQNPKKQGHSNIPLFDNMKNNQSDETGLILIFGLVFLIWIIGLTWNFYSNYGGTLTLILITILLFVILAIFYYINNSNTTTIKNKNNINLQESKKYNTYSDDEVIRVVSRADLCGKFVGHTAPMTLKVLEESLGKVLFIDEAYDLMHGPDDSFGMEILTTLNLFLSQHPGEIIVILAGYQSKLNDGIFTYQPGLRRRFGWQHIIEGYSISELFEIFKFKLHKEEWLLDNEKETRLIFDKYPDAFENQAGDIDRILFYTCLEHSRDFVKNDQHVSLNHLTASQVERGILKLLGNSIKTEDDEEETFNHPMSQFMSMFRPNKKPKKSKVPQPDSSSAVEELSTLDSCNQLKTNEISPF